jgi:excisionase family DNA binding protein
MAEIPVDARPLFTITDVERRLRVSKSTVRRWIDTGELTAFKVGGSVRILPRLVDELLRPVREEEDES